jgi:threonyl-tRNA synthetase
MQDIEKIQTFCKDLIAQKTEKKIERMVVDKQFAIRMFQDNPFKVHILKKLPDNEEITLYKTGDFIDLCKGPHIYDYSAIREFSILRSAGSVGHDPSGNLVQMQRIYGIAFPNHKDYKVPFRNLISRNGNTFKKRPKKEIIE